MPCPYRAVLLVTRSIRDTSTSIARERKNLTCSLAKGHSGPHRDLQYEEEWRDDGQPLTHILRHEDETPGGNP